MAFLWVIEMNIKRYEVRGGRSGLEEAGGPAKTDRQVVLLSDHIASHAYDEAKERELFESTYPLENGVTWRAEAGNEGRYCVWIDCKGGFWACVNAAFGFQQKWEVWSKCAKYRARSAE